MVPSPTTSHTNSVNTQADPCPLSYRFKHSISSAHRFVGGGLESIISHYKTLAAIRERPSDLIQRRAPSPSDARARPRKHGVRFSPPRSCHDWRPRAGPTKTGCGWRPARAQDALCGAKRPNFEFELFKCNKASFFSSLVFFPYPPNHWQMWSYLVTRASLG